MDLNRALFSFDYDSIYAENNKSLTKVSDPNYKPPQQTIVIKDPENYSILPPAFQAAIEIEDEMIKKINQIKEDEYYFKLQELEEEKMKNKNVINIDPNNNLSIKNNQFPFTPIISIGLIIGLIILFNIR